ncbi:urokinase plasminogen activator surface receptor-like [Nematolebias whitei]|uniref:urokinase plasminogen activator surface receptor-like n=1 Tax=Nematolebias whitei TaxID=451745 RepID=UPI00189B3FD7|nr:urokinase plasminogen activator surface receptor-like [Nematolebias whitei]
MSYWNRMKFFTVVLGLWLSPKVNALKCYECVQGVSGTCTETTKDCPSQDFLCGAITLTTYKGGLEDQQIRYKKCFLAVECVEGSVNFGSEKTVILSHCCNSDLCNTKAPVPKFIPNGKKCYSCEGQKCTRSLNCDGSEDYCIKSSMTVEGEMKLMKGCASKIMCWDNSSALFTNDLGSRSSCCQGDYCNGASSTRVGLLLLTVPFIAFVLFS